MTTRQSVIGTILALFLLALGYLISPWVGAFLWSHRVSRSVKIETSYPGCIPGKEAPESVRCKCEIVFGDVVNPASLSFEGDLRKSYDASTRTFIVSGTGKIRERMNEVDIFPDRIVINKTDLPHETTPSCHVFISLDGTLKNSRIDIAR